jgi:predicted RNA binding protein YcfA (HicA-like mRNA interferase family)
MTGGRLPVVSGRNVVRALTRAGFVVDRIAGSHHVMVFPGDPTRTVTVPVHAGRDLKTGHVALDHPTGRHEGRRIFRISLSAFVFGQPRVVPVPCAQTGKSAE